MRKQFKPKLHVYVFIAGLFMAAGSALGYTNENVRIHEDHLSYQNRSKEVKQEWIHWREVQDFSRLPRMPLSSRRSWAIMQLSPKSIQTGKFDSHKGWKASGRWKVLASSGIPMRKNEGVYERWITNGQRLPFFATIGTPRPKFDPFEFGGLVFCSIDEGEEAASFGFVCLINKIDVQGLSMFYDLKPQGEGTTISRDHSVAPTNSTTSALKLVHQNRGQKIRDFEQVFQTLSVLRPLDVKRCAQALILGVNSGEFRQELIQRPLDHDLAVQIAIISQWMDGGYSAPENRKAMQRKILQSAFESKGISPEQKTALEEADLKKFLYNISHK